MTGSSGGRSAPTAAPASPATSRSAREPPTPTIPGTGSTTAITRACRSTAGSPIRNGRTIPTAPGTTPTGRCTSWTSTPRQCPCLSRPSGLHPAGKGGSNVEENRDHRRGANGRFRSAGHGRHGRRLGLDIDRLLHQPGGKLAHDGRRLSGAAGLAGSGGGDLPGGSVQREPLRVVARGQARYRGPRRHVEVLLRQVLDLLHVLSRRVPDPGRDAVGQQPGPGL